MKDLTITLHPHGGKHLYEQIYLHIKNEIRQGKLLQGERLPSTRYLAEFLQVSRSTVELAYDQLLSEGYIEAMPYRGYFVCPVEELYDLGEEERPDGEKNAEEGETGAWASMEERGGQSGQKKQRRLRLRFFP